MTQIHVTIKSFQWYQIKNTILFIKKIQFLLNYRSMTNPPTKIEKQSNTVTSLQRKNRRCKINKMSFTSFPKKRKLFTVLRSPHIDKKSREQFQFVFHKLKLVLNGKNDNKTNLFIFLLKNSEFPGVEMEIILNYHSCLHCL
jgi:ribosomal protein S10